jgi:hypothetical protein
MRTRARRLGSVRHALRARSRVGGAVLGDPERTQKVPERRRVPVVPVGALARSGTAVKLRAGDLRVLLAQPREERLSVVLSVRDYIFIGQRTGGQGAAALAMVVAMVRGAGACSRCRGLSSILLDQRRFRGMLRAPQL